jgi:integrase
MPRKKSHRNAWGTVVARYRRGTDIQVGWIARYVSPLPGDGSVNRNFPLDSKAQAFSWLDAEHELVKLHERGEREWLRPTQRKKARERSNVLFGDYADQWIGNYQTKSGNPLRGTSRRKLLVDIQHLKDSFGNMKVIDIHTSNIRQWLDHCPLNGEYARYHAYKTMRAIMGAAAVPGIDGEAAIIEQSPCTMPISRPESKQSKIDPPTPEQLRTIYENMPDYTRISVYLSATAGGLRESEVCALQRRDIDLKNHVLHVRHSINRGSSDRGKLRIDDPKTRNSVRDVVIPEKLIPMLEEHLSLFTANNPEAMVLQSKTSNIVPRTLLYKHFKEAAIKAGRPDLHFHTLRAAATTNLVLSGGTIAEVMQFAGHSDSKTAVEKYQRVLGEHKRKVADNLGERLITTPRNKAAINREIEHIQSQIKLLNERIKQLIQELENKG